MDNDELKKRASAILSSLDSLIDDVESSEDEELPEGAVELLSEAQTALEQAVAAL